MSTTAHAPHNPNPEHLPAPVREVFVLTREEVLDLAQKVFQFCQEATGVSLYPYQVRFGLRLVQSLLLNDGEEITGLFSRQSGKTETIAVVVVGCMVLLPTLANMKGEDGKLVPLALDSRIAKFKRGFWVGVFAPVYSQTALVFNRMSIRMGSTEMRATVREPEIDLEIPEGRKCLDLPNGSHADSWSAAPGTKIEGPSYHFLVCDESQDISDRKMRKSIHPMGAAYNASIVKIGTPNQYRSDFYRACKRNRTMDMQAKKGHLQLHFRYDYEHAARYNPNYRRYVAKEMERLGWDSDDFRMAYRLHWLLERGMFVAPELLDECGVEKRDKLKAKVKGGTVYFSRPDYPGTYDGTTENQVAAIDFGRAENSTVVTVARVWWDNPIDFHGDVRYYTHIVNWLELVGDDHERQYPQIMAFLNNYRIGMLIADATGKGDPIVSRLDYDLNQNNPDNVMVIPFVFSPTSKHDGYTLWDQELKSHRFTFPAGPGAQKLRKWRRFVGQAEGLQKNWRGRYMVVEAPSKKATKDADKPHDDFPDSAMMLCWAVNKTSNREIQNMDNPFVGRHAIKDTLRRTRNMLRRGGGRSGRGRWR